MAAIHDAASNPSSRKRPEAKPQPTAADTPPDTDLFTLTIQAKTGQVVKLERSDSVGERHELTEQERTDLAQEAIKDTLEALIERAFEAGIACALGDSLGEDEAEESEEEADLRHLLIDPLIQKSPAQRLIQLEVLSRAFLGTMVRHAIDPGSPPPGNRPVQQRSGQAESTTHRRTPPAPTPGSGRNGAN
jgi:hypothetical protein